MAIEIEAFSNFIKHQFYFKKDVYYYNTNL